MSRYLLLLVFTPLCATAQTACPEVNFLTARTVSMKPSAATHIDAVRQPDGSYTGYEVADTAPYLVVNTTPRFEQQFSSCLPRKVAASRVTASPVENPPGAGSQAQVSTTLPNGNTIVVRLSNSGLGTLNPTLFFDLFDAAHHLLVETPFTSAVTPPGYVGSANEHFESLALADLNNDGKLDLLAVFDTPLAAGTAYGGVWTFLGNGDGTFQPGNRQVLSSAGMAVAALSIAVGDLNGDGKPDLVLGRAIGAAPLILAFGNGDGSFSTQTQIVIAACSPTAVIADLNRDGKADLILGPCSIQQFPAAVQILLGNGNGTFQDPAYYPVLMPPINLLPSVPFAVGDLNGDGIPDIASAGGSILFGDGLGGFPNRRDYAQTSAASVMIGDVDSDGIPDLLFGSGNPAFLSGSTSYPSLTVLFGAGAGAFLGAPVSAIGTAASLIVTGDFDGDGIPDMAIGGNQSFSILTGRGDGQFATSFTRIFAAGNSVVSLAAADFNRDGKTDLAVLSRAAGQVQVYPGLSDVPLGPPFILSLPSTPLDFVAAADLNGDTIPDLVITAGDALLVALGKGDGTFAAPVSIPVPNVLRAGAPAFGDFNGDGRLDIAIPNTGGFSIVVLFGKGDGTFPTSASTSLPCQVQGDRAGIAVADFNSDGRLDLAVGCNAGSHPFTLTLLGGAGGSFTPDFQSQGGIYGLAVADINGDHIPDLIAGAGVSGGLTVQLGTSVGNFDLGVTVFPYYAYIAVNDFNREGLPDAALVLPNFGVVSFLNLAQPPALTVVSAATFAPVPLTAGEIATAFGDFGTGQGLKVTVQAPNGPPIPTSVLYSSPTQVNFVMPAALPNARVTVAVSTSLNQLTGQVEIVPTAPVLFTVGSGRAAAYAVTVAPDGTQTLQSTDQPIRISQTGQTYLSLFGTGFGLADTGHMDALIAGTNASVTYAGPQPDTPGLDQVNILLSPSLAGAGRVPVFVVGDLGSGPLPPMASNNVYITIQ